jgi:transcriptional regulator with XRE-family HTH domain
MDLTKLGTTVKRLRLKADLSQAKLARAAGLYPRTVLNIEHARSAPTYETLASLATALGVKVEALVGRR